MPVIKISEQESTSFAEFDATENSVLIPMLYTRSFVTDSEGNVTYEESEDIRGKLYHNSQTFRQEMIDHKVFIDEEGTYDKSFVMAYELLLQGLTVIIKPITFNNADYTQRSADDTQDITVVELEKAYEILENAIVEKNVLKEFEDRNLYNIKFISSGGYTNCSTEDNLNLTMFTILKQLAASRGDAIALVEYDQTFVDEESIIAAVNNSGASDNMYAVGCLPWYVSSTTATGSNVDMEMPASFGYLMAYANSVKFNSNWFAAAGVVRGYIPNFKSATYEVGEALMHLLQCDEDAEGTKPDYVVNPIYNAGNYGYRIWGNRVLGGNDSTLIDRFMNFLNVRVLLCDIKKQIYHSAMRVTFEPNDDIVWINFKTLVNPLLEKMKSGRGISWYKWTKEYTPEKATIKAILTIRPIEALENIKVDIVLTDEDASISELV